MAKAKNAKAKANSAPAKAIDSNVNIGISNANRSAIAAELQLLLADENLLYIKTRNFHWNVEGMEFGILHKFFEEQYGELAEMIDAVAERIRKIGHLAMGSMRQYLDKTRLKEEVGQISAVAMLKMLLADHEAIIRTTRDAIDKIDDKYEDAGTADFLTGIMEQHEKMAWMIRAHVAR